MASQYRVRVMRHATSCKSCRAKIAAGDKVVAVKADIAKSQVLYHARETARDAKEVEDLFLGACSAEDKLTYLTE